MDLTFPRSLLGEDDGRLNYKVVSYILGSGVTDRMTNAGSAPGVVGPPVIVE
jgi:hypothetical protein